MLGERAEMPSGGEGALIPRCFVLFHFFPVEFIVEGSSDGLSQLVRRGERLYRGPGWLGGRKENIRVGDEIRGNSNGPRGKVSHRLYVSNFSPSATRTLRNNGSRVWFDSQRNPIQLSISIKGLRIIRKQDHSRCQIQPLNLTGCYSCTHGAEFSYRIVSDYGEAWAQVECGELSFATHCNLSATTLTERVALSQPLVDLECQVTSPGGSHNFTIKGHLAYVPVTSQVTHDAPQSLAQEAQESSLMSKLENALALLGNIGKAMEGFLDILPYLIMAIIATLIVSGLAYLALKLSLLLRLWRALVRTMFPVLWLLASQVEAENPIVISDQNRTLANQIEKFGQETLNTVSDLLIHTWQLCMQYLIIIGMAMGLIYCLLLLFLVTRTWKNTRHLPMTTATQRSANGGNENTQAP